MKKHLLSLLACVMALLAAGVPVRAAGQQTVMNAYPNDDSITLFIKDGGEAVEKVYIGQEECTDFRTKEVGATQTIVLIDNSLSIPEEVRENIVGFLIDLVASGRDGDIFSIATFAQQLTWITRECDSYLEVKRQAEGITYTKQESYLMSAVYELFDELDAAEETMFTRVVVIADGSDHEKLGYTDEEFHALVEEKKVPFYSIGCHAGDNTEELKRLFAISRISNGRDYMLDEMSVEDILQDMAEAAPDTRLDIGLPKALCDGERKTVRVDYGGDQCSIEVAMPFVAATPLPELTASPAVTASPAPEPGKESGFNWIYVIIPVAVLAVGGLVVAALIFIRKKKNEKPIKPEKPALPDLSGIGHSKDTVYEQKLPSNGTEFMGDGNQTELLSGSVCLVLRLQDIQNPVKQFKCRLQDKIYIGKDSARCQIVLNYSKYVSGVHCTVFINGDSVSVRDGSEKSGPSTNGTFVNNKRAGNGVTLVTGSVLRLGDLSFTVSFK